MQEYLNLVDWKGLELPSTERRCNVSVKEFERSPTVLTEWIELKETLAKFQSETGKKTSDDKGSNDMKSKAECKRKSDASPVEFCRRSLAGGNKWDSLANLQEIVKLWGMGADDVKEVREIVQHHFTNIVKPARSKRDSGQAKLHVNHLLFQLVDTMHSIWDTDSFLDQAQELVKKAIHEHAEYNTAELDRSRPFEKGAAARRRLGEHVAKPDTPSEVKAICTVRGRRGVWQRLSQDTTGSRWQVLSVQRRDLNDENSKFTVATDQHDFYQHRSEVCWQITRQARR